MAANAKALTKYRQKRDFGRTGEPRGRHARSNGFSFVVQKHDARRLHYDFRLELDGVLISWAVPRGPSLDPRDKRLAVETEAHPIEYGSFEGTIPAGQYGAGTVMVWDHGTWSPAGDPRAGYQKGHLEFVLDGQKLKGKWHLVRTGLGGSTKPNWLLIKAHDDAARDDGDYLLEAMPNSVMTGRTLAHIAGDPDAPVWDSRPHTEQPAARGRPDKAAGKQASTTRRNRWLEDPTVANAPAGPLPEVLEAELATLVKQVPDGADWLHEIKFDGYRMIGRVQRGAAKLVTRNDRDWTGRFPVIAQALQALPTESAVLDGEVVVLRSDGASDFGLLQNALQERDQNTLVYCAFDLLYLEGRDLRALPLEERKRLLEALLRASRGAGQLRYTDHVVGNGPEVLRQACRLGLEGVVSKRRDAAYHGGRGRDWLKTKCSLRQEFVIGGYTEPAGSRRHLGALLLGVREGDRLAYCGKVGTGFDEVSLRDLESRLVRRQQRETPFEPAPKRAERRGAHWVTPDIVCEVEFSEFTSDGRLRHATFRGLREDKNAQAVVREVPRPKTGAGEALPSLTHPNRLLYPEVGLTKRELYDYYRCVAFAMLPHVVDRPLTLVRCPKGHQERCFFQKHATSSMPAAIRRVYLPEKGRTATFMVIEDLPGLLELVQLGALEIHTGGARAHDAERPDLLVFDLDPDTEVVWERVIVGARLLRDLFGHLGLESFLKTTGGKGLHVCVPVLPGLGWHEVAQFCRGVADAIVLAAPDQFVATMSKRKRKGKIFVDYVRNTRGASFIAPYSTRARIGAPVALPIDWQDLTPELHSDAFRLRDFGRVWGAERRDPWASMSRIRQSLTPSMLRAVRVAAGARVR
jgi:bifunctional non-homologous end joining protein LigD